MNATIVTPINAVAGTGVNGRVYGIIPSFATEAAAEAALGVKEVYWDEATKKVKSINRLANYTVATLPASPILGDSALVTDALAPVYGATVAGSGAIKQRVLFDGTNWICE